MSDGTDPSHHHTQARGESRQTVARALIELLTLTCFDLFSCSNRKTDNRPYLDINILGRRVPFLADTGATRTIMNLMEFTCIPGHETFKRTPHQNHIRIRGVSGTKLKPYGVFDVPLELAEGHTRMCPVIVVANVISNGILGMDILDAENRSEEHTSELQSP